MSATLPRISDFLADTGKQYSSGVEKYTEGEKMAKKELDDAQAAYDECNSELETYKKTIIAKKLPDDTRTRGELRRLMNNEKRAKNHLDHAQLRYDSIKRTLDLKLTEQMIKRQLKANKSAAARSSDSGAGVMSMAMPHVDPGALPTLEVSRGAMAMAVPSQSDATSAQRSPSPTSPVGCWRGWCKSKKRDSPSKTGGGRKYKSKRFKTKRTYKKRRTSRK
jgi:hypothetical protein